MFEKAAEEYVNKDTWLFETARQDAKYHFQQGAEFGYNKANEWHYVKDGDLPKTHGWYWVQYENGTPDCLIVTKNLRFLNHHNSDVTDCIYAWKEIVFPKESEING